MLKNGKHTLKILQREHHKIFKASLVIFRNYALKLKYPDPPCFSIECLLLFRPRLNALLARISPKIFTCLVLPIDIAFKVLLPIAVNPNLFSSGLRSGTRFGKRFSFDNIGWRQLTSGILDADIKISSKSRTFRCLHFKHSSPLHSHTNFKIRKSLFPSSNPSYSKMRPKTPSTIGSIVQNK